MTTDPGERGSAVSKALMLPLDKIRDHPGNPRRALTDIDELAASMREHGLLQPVVVAPDPDDPDQWLLHAGHRRVAAAKQLKWARIAAVEHEIPAEQALEIMLVENLQRAGLTPIEVGRAVKALIESRTPPMQQQEVARRLGRTDSWVSTMLLFLELDPEDQAALDSRDLSWKDAMQRARARKAERGGLTRPGSGQRQQVERHFTNRHPLAADVRVTCILSGHDNRTGLSGVGCEACWEAVIRADENGAVDALIVARHDEKNYLQALVDRLIIRGNAARVPPVNRMEAMRQLLERGMTPEKAGAALSLNSESVGHVTAWLDRVAAARRSADRRRVVQAERAEHETAGQTRRTPDPPVAAPPAPRAKFGDAARPSRADTSPAPAPRPPAAPLSAGTRRDCGCIIPPEISDAVAARNPRVHEDGCQVAGEIELDRVIGRGSR